MLSFNQKNMINPLKVAETINCDLLCEEDPIECFDGDDYAINHIGSPFFSYHIQKDNNTLFKDPIFNINASKPMMGFPLESQEITREMIENEKEFLPSDGYLKRLRSGDLDLSVRTEAVDWIWKACDYHDFGPFCKCLSINYMDRFLSAHELPRNEAWSVQLLAVACLSIASKMEGTQVNQLVELQVRDPKFVFEAKTIQRMELLVLTKLKWRMNVPTPISFIGNFLSQINGDQETSILIISKSVQVILCTIKGIDFLEFKPSEVAAAVAISVSGELQAGQLDKSSTSLTFIEKGRVMKCAEKMKNLGLIGRLASDSASSSSPSLMYSPMGVLDAAHFFRFKNGDSVKSVSSSVSSHIKKGRRV